MIILKIDERGEVSGMAKDEVKNKPNWIKIRTEYETTPTTYTRLAKKHGISINTLKPRAVREGWSKSKAETHTEIIQKTHQKAVENISNENAVLIDRVLKELIKIGFSDIKDYLAYRTEKVQIDTDCITGKPIYTNKQIVDMKDSDAVDGSLINEISTTKDGTFKFKLHDKMNALEKLGKYLKMFTDKTENTNTNTYEFNVVIGDDE